MNDCAIVIATMIVQCATFSKCLNPRNIDKTVSDIRIRIRFPFESSFWISVSGWKLTILPDIQPANGIVIISGLYSCDLLPCWLQWKVAAVAWWWTYTCTNSFYPNWSRLL